MTTRETTVSSGSPERLLLAQGAWMALSLVFLALTSSFELELYFVLTFLGLLAVAHLFGPWSSTPRWWRPVRLVLLAFVLVFVYVTAINVLEVLA